MNLAGNDSIRGGTCHTAVTQIQHLFEAQAARNPDAVAVSCGPDSLTYQELNTRANRLAWRLRELGVAPQTPVALCLERSLGLVVAIMAVLKAGGGYVPLDPTYPKERLSFMLQDCRAPILVTQSSLSGTVPAEGCKLVCIDSEDVSSKSSDNLPAASSSDALAYIIYTSGSTGLPKGVQVTHYNVIRLFTCTEPLFGFNSSDVWTLFHSYAFDFSVWEFWGALIYGGRLIVVPYLVSRSPTEFYELLSREHVTVLNQTPSAFRQLIRVESSVAPKPLALRYVIFGGEALELQSLRPWFELHGDERPKLINMYGITETTVHVTFRRITIQDVTKNLGSVIGDPLPDLQIHLLDEDLNPVSDCTEGEIVVGGEGVARGYLNRPELDRQRFIPDRFSNCPGARLYRSGDLARRTPSGDLEYLGRADHQIKIRGFRIELGEIESMLNQHPAIRESVVVAQQTGSGDKRLVGYVVPKQQSRQGANLTAELRRHLGTKLPDYMIPAVFCFLNELPLTVNGKVDRKALPAPDRARPELVSPFAEAQTDAQRKMASLWSEVLEIEPVGVNDNFFELGGDSIRAITLLSRLQQAGFHFTLEQLFRNPTIAGLLDRSSESHEKPLTVSQPFCLVSEADRASMPDEIEDAYPMIKLQTGMFYYNEINPASAVYHDVFSFLIQCEYDRDCLEQAFARLVQRHPILRTSFHIGEFSEPMQLVHQTAVAPFTVQNLRHLTAEAQDAELIRYIDTEKRVPFDRTIPPLIRFHVQLLAEKAFQLIISFHHVCLDGWSLAQVLTEILQDYAAPRSGSSETIAAPRLAYRDFVALERDSISSEQIRKFWSDQILDAAPQTLPRWPEQLRSGGLEQVRGPEFDIDPGVFDGIRKLAATAGVPLKTVLVAAHQKVMSVLYGQTDVISGLVCNGRPEELDGDKIVGLFLNTLPIRVKLEGGSWIDLIKDTFAAERAIIPNRRFPLSEIQEINQGLPLFEAAFDFVHFHVYKHLSEYKEMGFFESRYFEANNLATLTTFMLDVTSTRLAMHIDYDPNLLCLEQVKQMSAYYIAVLKAMAASPDSRYEKVSLLDPAERSQILTAWNQTTAAGPAEQTIHAAFERSAARNPDAIALEFGEERLTYRELNRRADLIAANIRSLNLPAGTLVGVCLERSVDLVAALLGVLKAGCAYVPLDPAYPQERLIHMISDSQTPLIITSSNLEDQLQAADAKILLTDNLNQLPGPSSARAVSGNSLAYTIYTSGSTGRPKGVQIAHHSVVNLLTSIAQTTRFSSSDSLLAVTTFSFDIAGLEIFLPLISGAKLILAPRDIAADGVKLASLVATSQPTVMQATPATWRMLIDAGWPGSRSMKLFCGGEALSRSLADSLLARSAELWNLYGPTETTIWSSAWKVLHDGPVLIGRPLANTQIYILDPHLQPVPVCVAGEIYIGGDGLARGYLNLPGLTDQKFIPSPLGPGRLYRTGDLGRFMPDGSIECLGRVDHQVKIRGFRIEPGEIEAALRRDPRVREALVIAREDSSGEKNLVAYVIPQSGCQPGLSDYRQALKTVLPDYMIPSVFVSLPALPLTPAGKVDRKALPVPESVAPGGHPGFVAPTFSLEIGVAEIWQEVFHIAPIGLDDNFFDLGGHSLTAIRVIVRVRERFGIELPLAALFSAPTVRGLVDSILKLAEAQNPDLADMAEEVNRMSDEEAARLLAVEKL